MSQNNYIRNTFIKGMDLDSHESMIPQDSYRFALNAVNQTTDFNNFGLANEQSNELWAEFSSTIAGLTYIEERNASLVFTTDGSLHLMYHEDGSIEKIMSGGEFGCVWNFGQCEWMYGEIKTGTQCGELVVYFSVDCTYYRVNIDEMLDEGRRACIEDCEHFQLLRVGCTPKLSAYSKEGGGNLPAGAYQFVTQLEDSDGTTTNWFDISNTAYVESENNISGEDGFGSVVLNIDGLDPSYEKVNIAVIKTIAGVTSAELITSAGYNEKNLTYEYGGTTSDARGIDLAEILVKRKTYIRGRDLMQDDGRLYLYRVRQERNVNYQKYANQIRLQGVDYEVPVEQMKKYHYKSLMRGEVYAFGVVLNFNDGTKSPAFHIPGRPTNSAPDTPENHVTGEIIIGTGGPDQGAAINAGGFSSTVGSSGSARGQINYRANIGSSSHCDEIISSFPYNENFEDEETVWTNEGEVEWIKNKGATPTEGTGPLGSVNLTNYYYVEATDNKDKTAILQSPCFNLTNVDFASFSFQYHMNGEDITEFAVEASSEGTNWIQLWSESGSKGDQWHQQSIDLSGYRETYVKLRFVTKVGDERGDIAIDALSMSATRFSTGGGSGGSGGSSGGGSTGATYSQSVPQYKTCTYDTSDTFERKITVRESEDEDIKYSRIVQVDNENTTTIEPDAVEGLGDFGDYFDVPKVREALEEDLDDISRDVRNQIEWLTEHAQDKKVIQLDKTSNYKEAADDFIQKAAIEQDHQIAKERARLFFEKLASYTSDGDSPEYRCDWWTDSKGNNITEIEPKVVGTHNFREFQTNHKYPDTCDCDGNRMYPEGNVTHHWMPVNIESPHYVSSQVSVPNPEDGANSEDGDTYIRPLGLRISNIYIPREDELPKPLCPINPFSIVMVKRTRTDRIVIAKGLATGCFEGEIAGRSYRFPRHGVNSFETVDRFIKPQDNPTSRFGYLGDGLGFNFHSLDTTCQKVPLYADQVSSYLELFGSGWRYGLYARGEEPDDFWHGTRTHQRGCRQAVMLGGWTGANTTVSLKGITYAPGNSIVTPPPGMELPLMNRYRESSVYFEVEQALPFLTKGIPGGGLADQSFVGDTLDHAVPIKSAAGLYVGLSKFNYDIYGGVDSMTYIDSGIRLRGEDFEYGSFAVAEGITGDVFIGLHSFRRTGYVSEKVGASFPVQNGSTDDRDSGKERDRTVCDNPEDWLLGNILFGIDSWFLPAKDGDVADAKNWAGLHFDGARVQDWNTAADSGAPTSDFYFPKVVKTLVSYYGEFETNPYFRQTGKNPDQLKDGEVFYPKLKNFLLDSAVDSPDPQAIPWTQGWLNRFYDKVDMPSLATFWKRQNLKALVNTIFPTAMGTLALNTLDGVTGIIAMSVVFPILRSMALYYKNVVYSDQNLNKMLGIPSCTTDESLGQRNPSIVNWEDNYCRYSGDFNKLNDIESFYGMPALYNTCDCDDCEDGETTNEIFYSNKQVLGSDIDQYRNFKSNNYLQLPAHAGKLMKMFKRSNRLYAHTTDGLWTIQYGNEAVTSSVGQLILGSGGLLTAPQMILEGVSAGYAGTMDPNASIATPLGYFFYDRRARIIYRFSEEGLEDITRYGVQNFFREKGAYCNSASCADEKTSGAYYSLGWDPRNNRLLVTKKETDQCASWTMSYDPYAKRWVSFHSYIPVAYNWDRNRMYTVKGSQIWKHDDSRCNYQTFYGTHYPFMLEWVTKQDSLEQFRYKSTILETEAMICAGGDWLRDRDITFNKVAMYNTIQGTGTLDLRVRSDNYGEQEDLIETIREYPTPEIVRSDRHWRLNELHDYVLPDCLELPLTVTDCPCQPIKDINEPVFDCSRLDDEIDFKNRIISDKYLVQRFTFDSRDDTQLLAKYCLNYINDPTE